MIFVIGMSDSKAFLKANDLIKFFDDGGELFLVGDIDIARPFRKTFFALGVEPSELGTEVVDFVNNNGSHVRSVRVDRYYSGYPFLEKNHTKPIYYRGIGLKLNNYVNDQVFPLVRGGPTLALRSESRIEAVGQQSLLVAVQGTNNARALLTGSLDLLSD